MQQRGTQSTEAATPIWISRRTQRTLIFAGSVVLALLLWRVTTLVSLLVGGAVVAAGLSFPVDGLSRVMPRRVAIAMTLVLVAAAVVLAITVFAPVLAGQLRSFMAAVPEVAVQLDERVPPALDSLASRGLLPDSPEHVLAETQTRLLAAAEQFGERILGQLGHMMSGVAGVVIGLAGILLVAVTLLANARGLLASVLRAVPHQYRRDVRSLWQALGDAIARYLGGLTLSLIIEGLLATVVFHLIGLPYAVLIGAWVSVTAVIPYVSAWLGYGPAVLIAFAISPSKAVLTLVLGVTINAVMGNLITPRIQGQAVHVHPMFVFVAVITGGELFGIPGVVLAVPAMAVLRVLYDFLRARVRVAERSSATRVSPIPDATREAAPASHNGHAALQP